MKRPIVSVHMYTDGGRSSVTNYKSAWNSAMREGEAMVREYARNRQEMFSRGTSKREGDIYVCTWTGDRTGAVAVVRVERETP